VATTHTPTVTGTPDSIVATSSLPAWISSWTKATGVFSGTPTDTLLGTRVNVRLYKAGCSNVDTACTLKVVYGTLQLDSCRFWLNSAWTRYGRQGDTLSWFGRMFGIQKDSISLTGRDSAAFRVSCTNTLLKIKIDAAADTGWRDTVSVTDNNTTATLRDTVYHVAYPTYTVSWGQWWWRHKRNPLMLTPFAQ
jgi:hypothetical protein